MTVTTNEFGQENIFAKEPPIIMTDHPYGVPHNERAELLNGRFAMMGLLAAFISYAATGKFFFGVW